MDKHNKLKLVTSYYNTISSYPNVLIVQNHSITSKDLITFKQLYKTAKIEIIKNNIFKLALKKTKYANLSSFIIGRTLLIYSKSEQTSINIINYILKNKEKYMLLLALRDQSIFQYNELIKLEELNFNKINIKLLSTLSYYQKYTIYLFSRSTYKLLSYLQKE